MSEDEGSGSASGSGLTVMYRCRHCPGAEFTAAERDTHRLSHRKGRQRGESPPLTLFEPVTVVDEEISYTPRRRKSKPYYGAQMAKYQKQRSENVAGGGGPGTGRRRPAPGKRESVKNYDKKVEFTRYHKG